MSLPNPIRRNYSPNVKDVNYLNKTFPEFRQNLIDFIKSYYPDSYQDFNESSPGMIFIELAAYVGDVLGFYIDNQFKENLLLYADEQKNIINISQGLGYKPKLSAASSVDAYIYQIIPALGLLDNYEPNSEYYLKIGANSAFRSDTNPSVVFRSTEDIDFADPMDREITVKTTSGVVPTTYLVRKKIKLISGEVKIAQITFGSPEKFSKIRLADSNVITILNVTDSDGFKWNEVDYLAQDVLLDEREVAGNAEDGIPPSKIFNFTRSPRRFVTRVTEDLQMELLFGSGTDNAANEIITLDSRQIANETYEQKIANTALNPINFLSTETFGLAPANTTITVEYLVGGGMETNVPSRTITRVENLNVANPIQNFATSEEQQVFDAVIDSVVIINEEPATGGGNGESVEEIRQNALAFFAAQNRVMTADDYIVRTYALPAKFGKVAKAFAIRDEQINAVISAESTNTNTERTFVSDPVSPNAVNLYVLGYNRDGKLTTLNSLVKRNLSKYLESYRMLTDEVNILDGFIVNIGVNFDIVIYKNYNMNEVLARAIDSISNFFDIDKWKIQQPVIMADLRSTIGSVEGVQSVIGVEIVNKYQFKDGRDYQNYRYPIDEALVNDILYPSLDPCIFEIRYPETDIVGRARQ
jgi:hypothetical protein